MDTSFLKLFYSDMKDMGMYNQVINKSVQLSNTNDTYEELNVSQQYYQPAIQQDQCIKLHGKLKGHSKPITCLTATFPENPNQLISGSSDNNVMVWNVDSDMTQSYGEIQFQWKHNDTISDLAATIISAEKKFVISSSIDGVLKLYNISQNECVNESLGTVQIIAVVLAPDSRKIVTISKDNVISVWNTLFVQKFSKKISNDEWFSCLAYSPDIENEIFATGGNDVKFWQFDNDTECGITAFSSKGDHECDITAITISPDGSIVASGDEKGLLCIWDVSGQRVLSSWRAKCGIHKINHVIFSPTRYWVCFAILNVIEIWGLAGPQTKTCVAMLTDNSEKSISTCISWSGKGDLLYSGHSDGVIRIWKVIEESVQSVIEKQSDDYDSSSIR